MGMLLLDLLEQGWRGLMAIVLAIVAQNDNAENAVVSRAAPSLPTIKKAMGSDPNTWRQAPEEIVW